MNNHKKFILLTVVLFNLILPLNIFAQETTELEQGQATVKQAITSGNRDFFTIVTTNNTTYYLVVDYDSNNRNVYFLKAVDEIDLIDLAGINPILYNKEEEPVVEEIEEISSSEVEEEIQIEQVDEIKDKKLDFISIIAMVGLVILFGYLIYSKFFAKKKSSNFEDDFDDDFENEENDEEETAFMKEVLEKKDREA